MAYSLQLILIHFLRIRHSVLNQELFHVNDFFVAKRLNIFRTNLILRLALIANRFLSLKQSISFRVISIGFLGNVASYRFWKSGFKPVISLIDINKKI